MYCKFKLLIATLTFSLLTACGATWDITRQDGTNFRSEDFSKDKYRCELEATAFSAHRDNGSVMGGVSRDLRHNEILIMCMESKGWKYTKTGTNLF